jgi:hypothetical protein
MSDQDDLEESEDFESLEDRILRGPLLGASFGRQSSRALFGSF